MPWEEKNELVLQLLVYAVKVTSYLESAENIIKEALTEVGSPDGRSADRGVLGLHLAGHVCFQQVPVGARVSLLELIHGGGHIDSSCAQADRVQG